MKMPVAKNDYLTFEETPEEIRKLLQPGERAPRSCLYAAQSFPVIQVDIDWAKKEMKTAEE